MVILGIGNIPKQDALLIFIGVIFTLMSLGLAIYYLGKFVLGLFKKDKS